MDDIERLDLEVNELNDNNVSTIFNYLKGREDLIEYFNNKEKSINQMYKYICDKAKSLSRNNVAMVQDNVVYMWAVTYFMKSNKELGLDKKATPVLSSEKKNKEIKTKQDEKNENIKEVQKEELEQINLFSEVNN